MKSRILKLSLQTAGVNHRTHQNGPSMWFGIKNIFLNPVFWEVLRKKDLKHRAGQPCCLLSNPKSPALHNLAKAFCSRVCCTEGQSPSANLFPNIQILRKEDMRHSGILMAFLRDIHEVLLAQMQKKIKQYKFSECFLRLSPQHFASEVCWFSISTSAGFKFWL